MKSTKITVPYNSQEERRPAASRLPMGDIAALCMEQHAFPFRQNPPEVQPTRGREQDHSAHKSQSRAEDPSRSHRDG